jgi:hypothetical protein
VGNFHGSGAPEPSADSAQPPVTRVKTPGSGEWQSLGGATAPASAVSRKTGRSLALEPTLAGNALTIVRTILPERKEALLELLTRMGTNIDTTSEMVFDELQSVHFMRWVVIDGATPSEPAQLAFESNYDGTLEQHFADLYEHGARAMHEIYRCCVGYPFAGTVELSVDQFGPAQSFLLQGKVDYEAFYVGRRGKSARRIKVEGRLRDAIEKFLDQHGCDPMRHFAGDPERVYSAIIAHLQEAHEADFRALAEPEPPPPERSIGPIALRAAAVLPLLAPLLPGLYAILRYKEATDVAESYDVLPPERARLLAEREDFQVQNQLTHVVPLKPGLFRLFTARLVLYGITTLARFYYNQGDLGGLATIHYARWVLIDGGKRLLFFSNYDGSWERYLGDFIDQAHGGLTSVWSNTRGFPKTSNLLNEGATDEERFKAWTRARQIPTQLWYSAYKHLTVPNIARNGRICAGLVRKPETRDALERWLELL